jgi:hypothetical protein
MLPLVMVWEVALKALRSGSAPSPVDAMAVFLVILGVGIALRAMLRGESGTDPG